MDSTDWGMLIGAGLLLFAMTFGSYMLGKHQERKDYTGGFIVQVEAAYWDGFWDGFTKGRGPVAIQGGK